MDVVNRQDTPAFIVIGAQKAGTTSLFTYLRQHPKLFLPREKELKYFSRSDGTQSSFQEYVETHFSAQQTQNRKCGEVSPEYLYTPDSARLIQHYCPNARLIAILRDPIERAYSHYRMMVRKGLEGHTFEDAVQERLGSFHEPASFAECPFAYLRLSKYGTLLRPFGRANEEQRLKVCFLEDLKRAPKTFMEELFKFLDVEPIDVSPIGQTEMNMGGRRKLPLWADKIIRHIGNRFSRRNQRYGRYFLYRYELWSRVAESSLARH